MLKCFILKVRIYWYLFFDVYWECFKIIMEGGDRIGGKVFIVYLEFKIWMFVVYLGIL